MKIIIFSEYFPPEIDGIGDYTYLLFKELLRMGQDVEILTLSGGDKECRINRLNKGADQFWHSRAISVLEQIHPDIVHFQVAISISKSQKWIYSLLFLPYLIKRKLPKTKVVFTYHQYPSQFISKNVSFRKNFVDVGISLIKHIYSSVLNKICNYFTIKWVDYIFIVDLNYAKFINRNSGIEFLPVPSNIPSVRISESEKKHIRLKYGLDENELVIGYFGKIFQEKNFEATLEVLRRIPTSKLLYIGKLSGNYLLLRKIKSTIKKLGLSSRIVETGYLSALEVAKCLNVIDVYVCLFPDGVSSKNASFLAATAQGIFAVTTSRYKQGYHSEENVFYISPPGEIETVIAAIKEYAGRKIIPNKSLWPQWDRVALRHIEVYSTLINNL